MNRKGLLGLALCAACGGVLGLCLPKPGLTFLAWWAIAPMLGVAACAPGAGQAAAAGWAFGFGFSGVAFHWIYSTCRFAQVPVPVSLAAWASLSAVLGLGWAVFGAAIRAARLAWPLSVWPWACAALWAAVEFSLSRTDLGLLKLGYTQWRGLAWIQGTAWTGPHALGALVMLANAVLAGWALRVGDLRAAGVGGPPGRGPAAGRGPLRGPVAPDLRPAPAERRLAASTALAALLLAAWRLGGAAVLARAPAASPASSDGVRGAVPLPSSASRTVAFLQPNIDQYEKLDPGSYRERMIANLDGLLDEARSEGPDFVVWPETSLPGWLGDGPLDDWVADWARRTRAQHIVGAMVMEARAGSASGRSSAHNAAVLFDAHGAVAGAYRKRHLVPFGEFTPFRAVFGGLAGKLTPEVDLDAGPRRPGAFVTPLGPVGATICYEAAFPHLWRPAAKLGAWVFVNLTNDGWYKDTWGPYQHYHVNAFRAVEHRTYVLRSANTGISGVFDPYGRVTAELGLGERGVLVAQMPVQDPLPGRSFYARWGDWFGWLCAAISLALLAPAVSCLVVRYRAA